MSTDPDQSSATPMPEAHVVFTDLDGVDGVLVDLNTKQYFQLNATASLIWRGLMRGLAVDLIAAELSRDYDVTAARARLSVEAAIRDFAARQLITSPRARTAP